MEYKHKTSLLINELTDMDQWDAIEHIQELAKRVSDLESALSSMYEFFQPNAWGSAYNRADALEDARRALGL